MKRPARPSIALPAVEDPLAAALHFQERRFALVRAYRTALRSHARRQDTHGLVVEPVDAGLAAIEAAFTGLHDHPNPYGRLVATLGASSSPTVRAGLLRALRPLLVSTFSYAVPSDEALDVVAELGRAGDILEIGAGGGYWARCLTRRGVVVHAFDRLAPAAQKRSLGRLAAHHPLHVGGPAEALRAYPDCPTLLLCWPPGVSNRPEVLEGAAPRFSRMGEEALAGFRGRHLVFVGARTASFGSPAFFGALDEGWLLRQELALPNLGTWRDRLYVYDRRVRLFAPGR